MIRSERGEAVKRSINLPPPSTSSFQRSRVGMHIDHDILLNLVEKKVKDKKALLKQK